MKNLTLSLLTCMSIFLTAFTAMDELPIGASMPKGELKLKDISGKDVSLNDAKKKNGLLVMFSCNTCPYVIKNQQRTNGIASLAQKSEVGVILINSNEAQRSDDDSFEAMKEYAKANNYNWHYAVDKNSELADAFGANRTPECFLFNSEGKLVYHGAIDDNPGNENGVSRNHLKEAMSEMISGKDVRVKTSRSVGCGIKRKG